MASDQTVAHYQLRTKCFEFTFKYDIDCFIERMQSMKPGQLLKSNTHSFKIGNKTYPLYMKFYPAGEKEEEPDDMAFYLRTDSNEDFEASYSIGFNDNLIEFTQRRHSLKNGCGWGKLMKKEKIRENPKYLKDGWLNITLKIKIFLEDEKVII